MDLFGYRCQNLIFTMWTPAVRSVVHFFWAIVGKMYYFVILIWTSSELSHSHLKWKKSHNNRPMRFRDNFTFFSLHAFFFSYFTGFCCHTISYLPSEDDVVFFVRAHLFVLSSVFICHIESPFIHFYCFRFVFQLNAEKSHTMMMMTATTTVLAKGIELAKINLYTSSSLLS